jgi:hypothetical protein
MAALTDKEMVGGVNSNANSKKARSPLHKALFQDVNFVDADADPHSFPPLEPDPNSQFRAKNLKSGFA